MSNDTEKTRSTSPRKGPEAPTPTHGTPPDVLDQAIRTTTEQAEDLDTKIQTLPEHQKLLAVLGITRPLQSGRLPEPYRAVSITVPRKNLGAIRTLLTDLALPCSSDFMGNQEDALVSLTYIVPHQTNLQHILDRANKSKIPATIAIAEEATLILRKEGSPVISMHRLLNDQTTAIPEGEDPHQKAVSISKDDHVQNIPRLQGNLSPTIKPITIHEEPLKTHSREERHDETSNLLEIAKFDTTHASTESHDHAKDSKVSIPREGSCAYLMIDQNFLEEQSLQSPRARALLNELGLIARSPDFYITSYNGYLVVMALAERAGSLKGMAKRMFKAVPLSKMFVGKGKISHHGPDNFTIDGFPQTQSRTAMRNFRERIYIDRETTLHRDGSLDEVETRATDDPRWLEMLDYKPKVSLRVGGPDKLVGYGKQYEELVKGITDDETKLIVLRGSAGMGKSRLIEEALSEDSVPSKIICSLDPSGKNIPGFGLMTIAEQIMDQLNSYAETSNHLELLDHPEARALLNYISGSQKEKLDAAQRDPQKLKNDCYNVLRLLNTGKTTLVVDDVHHADRFSVQYITALVGKYINQTDGKAILSMRPEEMYQPKTIDSLIQRTATSSDVKQVAVEGLDFSKDFIAREFVFHSLPKQIRQNPDGSEKILGPWYREIGRIARRSPFVMKTLMDEILSDPSNLIIEGEAIVLKSDVLDRIRRIDPSTDLGNYYTERMEKLPPNSKKFLQCLALLGGHATPHQVRTFTVKIFGTTNQAAFSELTAPLTKGGYIFIKQRAKTGESSEEGTEVHLQHETMTDLAVASLRPEEKLDLSKNLYAIFREDPSTHTDTKFSLMHTVASSPVAPEVEDIVWGVGYGPLIDESLQDAKRRNAVGKAYSIAETVLGRDGCPTIIKAVEDLQKPEATVPDSIKRIAIQILFAKAESAIYIGRFDEVKEVVGILEKIAVVHRGSVDIQAAYLLLFENEYIRANTKEMEKVYSEKLQNGATLPPALKAIAEIKLASRRNKFAEVARIYTEALQTLSELNEEHKRRQTEVPRDKRSPHPQYMEAFRLHYVRVPSEKLKRTIQNKGDARIDDDILLQPGAVDSTHMPSLLEIRRKLQEIEEARVQNPLIFNGYSELSLRRESADFAAFEGNYDAAIEILQESWRQAEQMELHQSAARQAKSIGDIYVTQGTSIIEKSPNRSENGKTSPRATFARPFLLRAINAYSNEGMIALAKVDQNDFYQAAMRIQRIRAIGLLCSTYKNRMVVAQAQGQLELETDPIRRELEAHIKKAMEDFIYINQWWGRIDQSRYDIAEISYYLTSYIGDIAEMAATLEIEIPEAVLDREASPFIKPSVIELGERFADRIFDNGIGELPRKQKGMKTTKTFATRALAA